jgi:hypothetical protein
MDIIQFELNFSQSSCVFHANKTITLKDKFKNGQLFHVHFLYYPYYRYNNY